MSDVDTYRNLETNQRFSATAGILISLPVLVCGVSLVERLARLFREPTADRADVQGGPSDAYRGDGGSDHNADEDAATDRNGHDGAHAVAVVVQAPPAGVRRFELTVRAETRIERVDPGLLPNLFETFDEADGVVRARSVDVDGDGKTIDSATALFTVRFAESVDPETVSVDGTLTGHDEEPVPWSRVRLTPVE